MGGSMQVRNKFRNYCTVAAMALVLGVGSVSFATLLGVLPGFPLLSYNATGVTTYNSVSNIFNITASPIAIRFSSSTPPRFVNPTGFPASETLSINIIVDESGALVGGIPGDDLLIRGEVDADGNGSIDYSGVLLTGEILQFGYENGAGISTTDFYDFRFVPTGGSLASFFTGKHIAVTTTSEASTFGNDFLVAFTGGAKGNVGPIDIPNHPPVCDAGLAYHTECAGGLTAVSLDGTQSHDEDNNPLIFSWTTDCPNATFDNANSSTPILTVDTSSGCDINCSVTLTVSDGIAAPVSCTATVNITDTNPPIPTCPANVVVECNQSTAPQNTGSATGADDCDPQPQVTYSDSVQAGACAEARTITRTWTVTDRCNNSASCQQTISVVDTTKPVITCPGDKTVTCQQGSTPSVTGTATATDNCNGAVTITYTDESVGANCPTIAMVKRTWKATDSCGNFATCCQTIKVTDNSAPTVTCPPNITIQCNQSTNPSVTGSATAFDTCDTTPTVTYTDTWECSTGCTKILKRKWKAKDDCGNTSSTCTQTITILDSTPPVITCPPDVNLICGWSTSCLKTGKATATDNCDSCPTVTYSDQVTGNCPKTIKRTWKAKDDCGNSSTCVQWIRCNPIPPCPHESDYWKNNCDEWPDDDVKLGDVTYNTTKINNLLRGKTPNGNAAQGDASVELAKQLIATKFSIENGSALQNIQSTINDADNYLKTKLPGSNPTGSSRNLALNLADKLENFNKSNPNGCDDEGDNDHNGHSNCRRFHSYSHCNQNHDHHSGCNW